MKSGKGLQRPSAKLILREALTVLSAACFLLSAIVSLKAQASHAIGDANAAIICVHFGDTSAALTADDAARPDGPATPPGEDQHCHGDCVLCSGTAPALAVLLGAPASALPTTFAMPIPRREAILIGPSAPTPPKQGPPAAA